MRRWTSTCCSRSPSLRCRVRHAEPGSLAICGTPAHAGLHVPHPAHAFEELRHLRREACDRRMKSLDACAIPTAAPKPAGDGPPLCVVASSRGPAPSGSFRRSLGAQTCSSGGSRTSIRQSDWQVSISSDCDVGRDVLSLGLREYYGRMILSREPNVQRNCGHTRGRGNPLEARRFPYGRLSLTSEDGVTRSADLKRELAPMLDVLRLYRRN